MDTVSHEQSTGLVCITTVVSQLDSFFFQAEAGIRVLVSSLEEEKEEEREGGGGGPTPPPL